MPLHWCTNNKDSKCIELLLEKVISGINSSLLLHIRFCCAGPRSQHQRSRWGHDDSSDVGRLPRQTEPHQGAPGKRGRPHH